MGMMIFLMASGLTLVFGLMDVINFGHSAFISFGAFIGVSVLLALASWIAAAIAAAEPRRAGAGAGWRRCWPPACWAGPSSG